jgi:hypothetical protein
MPSASHGVVTIACGSLAYTEMAIDLALSIHERERTPVALIADRAARTRVEQRYPGVFDAVVPMPAEYRVGQAHKFAVAQLTPYAHNLFIDADTLTLSRLDPIWPAGAVGMAMMGTQRARETHETHHGFAIRALIDEFQLPHYFDNHSGAFYFEREHARPFLRECFELYTSRLYTRARRMRGFVGDELAFGIVAGRRGMQRLHEPYPVLWSNELAALQPGAAPKPLCHFHSPPSAAALDWLVRTTLQRRRGAGLPVGNGSHWYAKSARAARNRRAGTYLERLRDALLRGMRKVAHDGPL